MKNVNINSVDVSKISPQEAANWLKRNRYPEENWQDIVDMELHFPSVLREIAHVALFSLVIEPNEVFSEICSIEKGFNLKVIDDLVTEIYDLLDSDT